MKHLYGDGWVQTADGDRDVSAPISLAGDWHGDQEWALLAIRSAAREGVSTILHVGDFGLDWPGAKRGRYEQRLNRALVDHGVSLIVSPGNHDNVENIDKLKLQDDGLINWRSNIRVLPKGGRTTVEGLRVGGLGGAYSVDQEWRKEGKDWWADEEPTVEQAERLLAAAQLIFSSHMTPLPASRSAANSTCPVTSSRKRTALGFCCVTLWTG